jgi:hypothetical protein
MVRERCLRSRGKLAVAADEAINYTWKAKIRKKLRFERKTKKNRRPINLKAQETKLLIVKGTKKLLFWPGQQSLTS